FLFPSIAPDFQEIQIQTDGKANEHLMLPVMSFLTLVQNPNPLCISLSFLLILYLGIHSKHIHLPNSRKWHSPLPIGQSQSVFHLQIVLRKKNFATPFLQFPTEYLLPNSFPCLKTDGRL